MELLLLLTVLIGVITIVVMILAGRYENKLKTSRFTLKKVFFRNLSVRGYEGTALFDKTEKYLYEAGGGLSTEAFIFFFI